jgi:predicted nucleotidyltransferase
MENARLSELFGGRKRFAILQALFLNPARWFSNAELAKLGRLPTGNTSRWLNRWANLGLVEKSVDGRNVRFRASSDPLLAGLHDIMLRNDALVEDIRAALPKEVESAVIFGSVARGEERAESDIDVLVLGPELSSIRVGAALRAVGRKHDRVINASVHSTEEFAQMLRDGDGFAKSVVAQKTIPLKGELPDGVA